MCKFYFFSGNVESRKIPTEKSNSFRPNFKTKIMGTTVGSILISYDVSAKNPEVKAALLQRGYRDRWNFTGQTKIYLLPNTTLWHPNKSSDQGFIDMQAVCNGLAVTLEKAISVKATEFVGF